MITRDGRKLSGQNAAQVPIDNGAGAVEQTGG